ncbi:hypothetical protein AGABI1DRAFT_115756 [Agaricus bisporus var. burnettii JB137-S8]|uniref:Uncharacterized protein n=1 Tax=Agaricus bisporus var. burnettii (strain JB137-S8 / ATCC MYA-4627 / FGSC 10392) TaxID=597362 RepID=K5WM59_AGABU|nr:hypothetical protein AGABI2DRAFT_194398 [Agaricus bisporus var. bisporus H97]XP_007332856.1 uncharacterized protein AGABI1DRAFT_115756 [Agaricus bisporus var. burnettii JB137-S8]EKM76406.1 hypothetical protein AGABI1DRAFT_115756 [Agaricus bisporus var. burnettii JB137-S8]EKV44308.1 hypothetical protein AGABI2DRAFT_194398 [Agaricus bisporus var. bisporus H97]
MWKYKVYIPTAEEIQRTARAVIRVLQEHDFECCLIGSTAAAIYGAENRNPRDVDVVILNASRHNPKPNPGQILNLSPSEGETELEEIKNLIIENSCSDFYLKPSKDPTAKYQILYYILTPSVTDPSNPLHRACKVDLLLPGVLGIPQILPPESIHHDAYFPELPLIPFLVLLTLKVRAWSEHRVHYQARMRDKVKYEESDIKELLDLGVNEYMVRVRQLEAWVGKTWVREMKEYVKIYVEMNPKSQNMWEEMGFAVKSEWSLPPEA